MVGIYLCLGEQWDGLHDIILTVVCIAVKSFVQLAPQLLKLPYVEYLLSEVFFQDPLERYFTRQRHKGGSNDTVHQVPLNAITLLQQQAIYKDLKTMKVEAAGTDNSSAEASQPLRKRA